MATQLIDEGKFPTTAETVILIASLIASTIATGD
jgi:hypothetical protein